MGWNNPIVPWSTLERQLSGEIVRDPITIDHGDGGDTPAWTRKRPRFEAPEFVRQISTVDYAELHCHSNFSFLDGASHPEELAQEAVRLGLTGLALTDHDGFYGVVRFSEAAAEMGLPTVFGAELSLDLPAPQNGEPDPIANLALVRSMFFPTPGLSLGTNKRQVLSQAQSFDPAHASDGAFVENVMWEQSHVLFVAVNVPGGSNNDADVWYGAPTATAAQTQEIADRTGADLRWLDTAFAQATVDGVVAVVILAQADMWDPEKGAAHQAGYEPIVQSIATHTTAFGKPVLMFNGDSHVYQTGNVFNPADPNYAMHPGYNVTNFHRVVVHGSTLPLEWLRLTIDPAVNAPESPTAFGPFSWERMIQP